MLVISANARSAENIINWNSNGFESFEVFDSSIDTVDSTITVTETNHTTGLVRQWPARTRRIDDNYQAAQFSFPNLPPYDTRAAIPMDPGSLEGNNIAICRADINYGNRHYLQTEAAFLLFKNRNPSNIYAYKLRPINDHGSILHYGKDHPFWLLPSITCTYNYAIRQNKRRIEYTVTANIKNTRSLRLKAFVSISPSNINIKASSGKIWETQPLTIQVAGTSKITFRVNGGDLTVVGPNSRLIRDGETVDVKPFIDPKDRKQDGGYIGQGNFKISGIGQSSGVKNYKITITSTLI